MCLTYPAHAVGGPRYVVKKGKTPVLTAEEARELLESIETVTKTTSKDGAESSRPDLVGLRDRALSRTPSYAPRHPRMSPCSW
jgi:hypothetical protein